MDTAPLFDARGILDYMTEKGVDYTLYHHDPVFTVAESEHVTAHIPGAHARNLFLRDKKERMFLVTLRHHTPVDLKKLADLLDVGRFSFGSADRLWRYLGVKPGSVTPLAILNDGERQVQMVLEKEMMNAPLINFHPLDNSMSVSMSPDALEKFVRDHGIEPLIVDLEQVAPD